MNAKFNKKKKSLFEPSPMRTLILGIVSSICLMLIFIFGNKIWHWYGISVFGGSISLLPYSILQKPFYKAYALEGEEKATTIWWIPFSIGVLERAFITFIISNQLSGVTSFIAAWLALKMAAGWQTWGKEKSTTYIRGARLLALAVSLISVFIATYAGIQIIKEINFSPNEICGH